LLASLALSATRALLRAAGGSSASAGIFADARW